MNHIYRVVYNAATNTYQAVPENSTGKHKTASEKSSCAVSDVSEMGVFFSLKPMALCAMAMGLSSTGAWAAPTGGHISAGDASIAQHGKITNIQQNSQKAAINWQTFGIKADETVNFQQPNAQAVILNRVIGNEKSVIDGAMNANGKVFISNPNGVMFGKNAQINVGALLATTAKIKDQDFMNDLFKFDQATGNITQLGDIKVPTGGVVALIAPIVENKGKITAPQGKVLLASAEQFSITLPENGQFAYTLDRGTLQGLVDNGGAILADGGHVILTAKGTDAVKKSLIKHTGKIEANTVQNKNGVIELLGDLDNTRLEASGSLKAEAEHGDGGFVETSAAELGINDLQVSTQSKYGKTGTWVIDPKDFIVAPSGGDMTGKKVEEGLQANNVTLKSRDGAKEGKGDVIINDEISWDKNTLTLNAENDIHINKTLNGTGTAKLALEHGQGTADGGQSDYYLDKNTPLKDRTVKVNLPEGKNFSTKKGSNGEVHEFDVIHKMPDIKKDFNGNWKSVIASKNFAFGKDIDVSYTKNYKGFEGWLLGSLFAVHSANIHGLGHTIDKLYLNADSNFTSSVGLFQHNTKGEIRNIGVTNVDIFAKGNDVEQVGSITGYGSKISDSYATGTITVSNPSNYSNTSTSVGGVVGYGNKINNSYFTGVVSTSLNRGYIGGLAGNGSFVSNSYAEGQVSTNGQKNHIGGLVGEGSGISKSYVISTLSSSGDENIIGRLAGDGHTISNSYAIGDMSVTGKDIYVGGLVGMGANIHYTYNTGNPVLNGHKGGIVGSYYDKSPISNSFFKKDELHDLQAIGVIKKDEPIITNVTGKTEAQLKDRTTFEGWDFDKVWYMNDGEMPKLRAFATNNQSTPTAPTNPTQPVNPTPTQPTQPSNPAVPTTPTAPTNPTQPANPTPTQPTQPSNPAVPTTPTVSTNPTQPVNPTPTQPTQPSNPAVPTTPTAPVTPVQSEQDNTIEKEKPKLPNFVDKLPCKSAKECANKGVEWLKREKGNYDTHIEQLLAEDKREKVFYLENPSIKQEDLDNYLRKLDGAATSSQALADVYLSDFPTDLKLFEATFGYQTTFHNYLSSVIQMNELSNLTMQYNKELDEFASKHIPTDSATGKKVSEHIEGMNWHFNQINDVSINNRRTYWGWEGTFMDSAHMMSDVLDFGVNAGKVVFAKAAVAMDVSLNVIEETKNRFTTSVNVTNNVFTTKDIVTDALDMYAELKKGNDMNPIEVKSKMIKISSGLEDVLGDGNLGFESAIIDLKDSIENIEKIERAISIVNRIPESALPKDIKEQVLNLLKSKHSLATTDGAMAIFDLVGAIPAVKSSKVASIITNGAKALGSIRTAYNNTDYRSKSLAYGESIKSMNSINKHLSNGLRERSRAIKAILR